MIYIPLILWISKSHWYCKHPSLFILWLPIYISLLIFILDIYTLTLSTFQHPCPSWFLFGFLDTFSFSTFKYSSLIFVQFSGYYKHILLPLYPSQFFCCCCCSFSAPQWGAADAEIKVPSGENTELNRSPYQAWSRSVYSHTCYAYCQGFLPCLFLPFQSIHLHFFQNLSQFFPVLACRIKWVSLLDAGSRVECPRHINRLRKHDLWKDDDLWNNI